MNIVDQSVHGSAIALFTLAIVTVFMQFPGGEEGGCPGRGSIRGGDSSTRGQDMGFFVEAVVVAPDEAVRGGIFSALGVGEGYSCLAGMGGCDDREEAEGFFGDCEGVGELVQEMRVCSE